MLNIKVVSVLAALILCAAGWFVREAAAARNERARTQQIKQSIRVQSDTAGAISHLKDR